MANKMTVYNIAVQTNEHYQIASTDATVHVQLVGEDELESEWCVLDNFWKDDFERGHTDLFTIKTNDVGRPLILRIKLKHGLFRKNVWAGDVITVTKGQFTAVFPLNDWVDEYAEVTRSEALLPQNAQHLVKEQRRNEVKRNKQVYQWQEKNIHAALPRHLVANSHDQLPIIFQQNDIKNNFFAENQKISRWNALIEVIKSKFSPIASLNDYRDLFSEEQIPDDLKPFIEKWDTDEEFARQILNGVNPCMIKRCTEIPKGCDIKDCHVKDHLHGEKLEEAMKAGHLYIINYFEALKGVPRNVNAEGDPLYCPDALCLFHAKDGHILPVAIQLQEDDEDSIFTPNDSRDDWILAKMYFRCIDSNYQEWISHYLHTHSAMEPICIALFRCLPRAHPMYKFLRPHLLTVASINTQARILLIPSTATANLALSVSAADSAVKAFKTFSFNDDLDIPKRLEKNGTTDRELLKDYYYRDDIIMLWDIIKKFVSEVVSIFYKCDNDVNNDYELQDFIHEVTYEGFGYDGNLRDFPTTFNTKDELAHFCTTVIATASIQHAAINFGQFDIYKFIPNSPSGMRQAIHKHGEANKRRILESLGDTKMASIKLGLCFALCRYSPNEIYIGEYPKRLFYEDEALEALNRFKLNLDEAGGKIVERNNGLKYPYEYLHPRKVPASIAI